MLSPLDGQLAAGIVMNDLWHAVEGWAVLTQHILVLLGPGQFHVHEALAALQGEGEVILAGFAVAHQVAGLLAQPQQRLCIRPADGPMVPALALQGQGRVNPLPNKGARLGDKRLRAL